MTASPVTLSSPGVARQPEAQSRLTTLFFITVGLVEAAYFINLVFMILFVYVLGK